MERVELLAPARDLACGMAAIDCGADAVYIGAPRFGARARVGNAVEDLAALARYAHRYWARVYATVNTLLRDDELDDAVRLIGQLYEAGVDALIVQDVGLLECDLPPLPLIASTQMHNHTPARVAFLEQVGFQRAILARELSLDQIRAIRQATRIELETFVHGALCVSYSGQCAMSYAVGGRSGNRGECAQPCRRRYKLVDREGTVLAEGHLLSLRDLNLSAHLGDLLDVGVRSFKIEGRLKDRAYVMNVVSAYRRLLDEALAGRGLARSSSGQSTIDWTPDLDKTFNRGYTSYFLRAAGPAGDALGALDTPKMLGELVGEVTSVGWQSLMLDVAPPLHSGDGLAFFDAAGELRGTFVHGVRGRTVTVGETEGLHPGMTVYRNRDHAFLSGLEKGHAERRIDIRLRLSETAEGFALDVEDEDGNRAAAVLATDKVLAEKPQHARAAAERQLAKTGDTPFACRGVEVAWGAAAYFLPLSALNALRREALERLEAVRDENRPVTRRRIVPNDVPFPERTLTYRGNVLNARAVAFYRRHGVTEIEPAAESGLDMRGRQVMRTRYCLKRQLGLCPRQGAAPLREPLVLVDQEGRRYPLHFDCAACEMDVFYLSS